MIQIVTTVSSNHRVNYVFCTTSETKGEAGLIISI